MSVEEEEYEEPIVEEEYEEPAVEDDYEEPVVEEEEYEPVIEEEDEENYSDSEVKKKSKKRKRESKKLKKKKKQKVQSDLEEEEDYPNESIIQDDEDGLDTSQRALSNDISVSGNDRQVESDFDHIMNIGNVVKKKGAAKEMKDRIQKESEDLSRDLIDRMKEAAIKDENLIAEGKGPAINKLKMCKEVKDACGKPMMQIALISEGLLEIFALWLSRKGNSTELPNVNIRTAILEILFKLPVATETNADADEEDTAETGITVDDLRRSQIGRFVKYLASHPNETASNKLTANKIIEKWTRLINKLSDNYSARTNNESKDDMIRRLREPVEEIRKITDQKDPQFSTRARVPRRVGFDFVKRPESKSIVVKDKIELSERQLQLQRKLNDLKRKGKK